MHHQPHRGFTLVELLVTITIAAILLAVAVPSYKDFIARNTSESLQSRLATAFVTGRVEAATRNTAVTVCASNNGTGCTGATHWGNGWIVITDANANSAIDGTDEILQVYQQPTADYAIRVLNDAVPPAALAAVSFNNQGFKLNAGRAVGLVCPPDKTVKHARGLTLELSGRVSKTTDGNGNNVHDYAFDSGDGLAAARIDITCP